MQPRTGALSTFRRIVPAAAFLLLARQAVAQDSSSNLAAAGLGMGVVLFVLVFIAAGYIYVSLALQTIANKTGNTQNSWLAWIPIANIFLMLSIAKKPMWWFV